MTLEAPTDVSQPLCIDSYTLAQEYVEWRLDEGSDSLDNVVQAANKLPRDVSLAILYSARELSDEGLYTFPNEVYGQCVRMWNESRKFIVTF